MRLIEGVVESDGSADDYEALRSENRELRSELAAARSDAARAKRESALAVSALRKQLAPLYRALQAVFGELDAFGADDDGFVATGVNSRTAAVWNQWKEKIGGQPAKLIDALLLHGEMTAAQIAIAIHINPKNVAQVVHKLNKAGLIQKNGGKYSLKQL